MRQLASTLSITVGFIPLLPCFLARTRAGEGGWRGGECSHTDKIAVYVTFESFIGSHFLSSGKHHTLVPFRLMVGDLPVHCPVVVFAVDGVVAVSAFPVNWEVAFISVCL